MMEMLDSVKTSMVCLVMLLTQPLACESTGPVVSTRKGFIEGKTLRISNSRREVDAFYGIPYAKPPIGIYRFKHPLQNDPWGDVLKATKKPNACMQAPDSLDHDGARMWNPNTPVSEDCLYLNVWRPHPINRNEKKAVMIWIYGGSYTTGTSTLDVYDGKYIAAENDVVVVSMQYRVGALGFLSLDIAEAPGNAGVMDQVMALAWVQSNIQAFGGDPRNVTLFGESSGAASVGLHLLSPRSRDKFDRAILQSGGPKAPWATMTQKEAVRRARALAEVANCSYSSSHDIAKCLRREPAINFTYYEYSKKVAKGICQFPFVPVIDGSFLLESPEMSFKRNDFKKTDVLVGSNINEGSWFLIYDKPDYFKYDSESLVNTTIFKEVIEDMFMHFPQYPNKINSIGKEAILFQYSHWKDISDEAKNRDNVDQAVGDLNFVCPVVDLAEYYAKAGKNVYYYEFSHRSSINPWPPWMGVLHGDEIMFVFGQPLNSRLRYRHKEKRLSKKMMKYWTNFAKTGDPNKEPGVADLNEWPIHSVSNREILRLDTHHLLNDSRRAVRPMPRIKHCAFWREYLPTLVSATADMSELEKQWKILFAEWSNRYIVDWKNQFDNFINNYERRMQECSGH